jgi:SAM-dependent methyltransferase
MLNYDGRATEPSQPVCRLCGRVGVEVFSTQDHRRPLDGTEYRVIWCHECDLGRLAAEFSLQEVKGFFDIPYYTHQSDTWGPKDEQRTLAERLIHRAAWSADKGVYFTPAELGPAQTRLVCDIGCGNGYGIKQLKEAGFSVVGVEPDPIARTLARRFGEVFEGALEALPQEVSRQRFDIVLMSHVLDACCDFMAALANVRSILSAHGTAIVEVPNCASLGFRRFGPKWPWVDIPRHQTFFTEKSLCRALKVSGLAPQKIIYTGYTRQLSARWRSHHLQPAPLWFVRTAFASRERKYDSIRVHATQP